MLWHEAERSRLWAFALFAGGIVLAASFGFCILAGATFFAVRTIGRWYWDQQDFTVGLFTALILSLPVAAGVFLARAGVRRGGHHMRFEAKLLVGALVAACALGLFVEGWMQAYPSPYDSKNLAYVLWKSGLYNANLDDVAAALINDNPNALLAGQTQSEIRQRFGYLRPFPQNSQRYRQCFEHTAWDGQKMMFLRQTDLAIVFEGDKSVDTILMKEC